MIEYLSVVRPSVRPSVNLPIYHSINLSINQSFIQFICTVYIWVNYKELTASSLEVIVSQGNHPQMALIQVSELL